LRRKYEQFNRLGDWSEKYYENNRNRIGSGTSLFATTTENKFMVAKKVACGSQTLKKENPLSLYIWRKKWLDSGQLQLLAKALKRKRSGRFK
jgi:hypothetical protein